MRPLPAMAMRKIAKTSLWASTSRRLLRITWPFFLVVVALVLLATESIRIVSATRAYVGGESLWSKAQKEAVYSLFRYAQTGSEADYRSYRNAISIPLGDRQARLELERPEPDLAIARAGFLVGQNDPADVDGMIMLFRRFRDVSFMSKGHRHLGESRRIHRGARCARGRAACPHRRARHPAGDPRAHPRAHRRRQTAV
jgi:hypothetical protein